MRITHSGGLFLPIRLLFGLLLPLHLILRQHAQYLSFPHPLPHTVHTGLQSLSTSKHVIQVVAFPTGPMIGYPVLRPIVRPHFIFSSCASHATHGRPPQIGNFIFPLLSPACGQFTPQEAPGQLAILVLRSALLHAHHQTSRQMGEPHCRLSLVDVLPARAGCPHDFTPDLGGIDIVVTVGIVIVQLIVQITRVWKTRQNHHADGARVGPSFFLRRGNPLDAVNACFRTEEIVGIRRRDLEDGIGEADRARGRRVIGGVRGELVREAQPGRKRRVHIQQIVGEDGGFRAAGPRMDFEETREGAERMRWDQGLFEVVRENREGRLRGFEVGRGELAELGVGRRVGEEGLQFNQGLQLLDLLAPNGVEGVTYAMRFLVVFQRSCDRAELADPLRDRNIVVLSIGCRELRMLSCHVLCSLEQTRADGAAI